MAVFHCRLLKTVPTHQELCTFQSYYYGNMSYYFNRLYRKKKYLNIFLLNPNLHLPVTSNIKIPVVSLCTPMAMNFVCCTVFVCQILTSSDRIFLVANRIQN